MADTGDEGRGTNSNEERGILRLPDEERGSFSEITSTRNEERTTLVSHSRPAPVLITSGT
jgi:hypothetical protein